MVIFAISRAFRAVRVAGIWHDLGIEMRCLAAARGMPRGMGRTCRCASLFNPISEAHLDARDRAKKRIFCAEPSTLHSGPTH